MGALVAEFVADADLGESRKEEPRASIAVLGASCGGGLFPCILKAPCIVSLAFGWEHCGQKPGRVAERLMATDCKSVAPCELRRFESSPVHQSFVNC